MRQALLFLLIFFLIAYAWKDWYKSLCGVIVLAAISSHESMPRSLFGIGGLNPYNVLLFNVLLARFMTKKEESDQWDMPRHLNRLLIAYLSIVLIAILRYRFNYDTALELSLGRYVPTPTGVFVDYFINSIKWVIPGLLLFTGCNSKERLHWAVGATLLMFLVLAVLVIKWMPLGLLADADALQRRAARVLDREIGFYRTNLSPMLAGAFWMFVVVRGYFSNKYTPFLLGCASITLLGMMLTGGRGGYLAWAVAGLIMLSYKHKKYILMAPLIILPALSLVPSVKERIMFGLTEESNDEYTQEEIQHYGQLGAVSASRTLFWPYIVEGIYDAPVFGHGFLGTIVSGANKGYFEQYNISIAHPHNAYLETLIDNGVIGSLPILLFFYLVTRYAWGLYKDKHNKICVLGGGLGLAALLTVLCASISGQSFYPAERSVGLWCALGLLLRIYTEKRKVETADARGREKYMSWITADEPIDTGNNKGGKKVRVQQFG